VSGTKLIPDLSVIVHRRIIKRWVGIGEGNSWWL